MGITNAARRVGFVIVLVLAPACSVVSNYRIASPPKPAPVPHVRIGPQWINGVALPAAGDLRSWEKATGERPAVIAMFAHFGAPFPLAGIKRALKARAVPLVQLDPSGISLAAIARGTYDRELRAYDAAIRSLNDPVLLSFGHEMNGVWYSWGCGHTRPQQFRAAWRHIHALVGAPQLTWVWTINDVWNGDPCPLRPWYPGAAYVDWVGIDGYLRGSVDTFTSAFGRTLAILRRFARAKPTLLAESGVPWGPGWVQRLNSLYSGAHHAGLRGIVYFDGMTANGDYRPQDHPAALKAFRRALRRWSP
jgi:mannan endo-1,4-beta-mannosidase